MALEMACLIVNTYTIYTALQNELKLKVEVTINLIQCLKYQSLLSISLPMPTALLNQGIFCYEISFSFHIAIAYIYIILPLSDYFPLSPQ